VKLPFYAIIFCLLFKQSPTTFDMRPRLALPAAQTQKRQSCKIEWCSEYILHDRGSYIVVKQEQSMTTKTAAIPAPTPVAGATEGERFCSSCFKHRPASEVHLVLSSNGRQNILRCDTCKAKRLAAEAAKAAAKPKKKAKPSA
jgi:hypothetical protein